jgi:hypothetical protein
MPGAGRLDIRLGEIRVVEMQALGPPLAVHVGSCRQRAAKASRSVGASGCMSNTLPGAVLSTSTSGWQRVDRDAVSYKIDRRWPWSEDGVPIACSSLVISSRDNPGSSVSMLAS